MYSILEHLQSYSVLENQGTDVKLLTLSSHLSSLFTNDYFGSLPGTTSGTGTCITNGQFANMTCHIGPGSSNVPHCLSRAVNGKPFGLIH